MPEVRGSNPEIVEIVQLVRAPEDWESAVDSLLYFPNLRKIQTFRVENVVIPKNIAQLKTIEEIELFDCKTVTGMSHLAQLPALRKVIVRDRAPEGTEWLRALQGAKQVTDLDLGDVKWKFLPEEVTQLTQIKNIDLTFNQLDSLPDSIVNLVNLEFIDLGFNRFETIPEILKKLPNLRGASFDHNPCFPYSKEDLKWIKSLRGRD